MCYSTHIPNAIQENDSVSETVEPPYSIKVIKNNVENNVMDTITLE